MNPCAADRVCRAAPAASLSGLFKLVAESTARRLAVIGLVKNAGKTTVVNAVMANVPRRFGLTSLGLDGERVDHLTGLAKPSIVPPPGTLIATTTGSLERSRYRLHILEELPFRTALGRVVVGIPGEDGGAVEVSGPTTLTEVRTTADRLLELGAEQVLVDGAVNRLGSASPRVTDGLIMATGAMVADSLDQVVEATKAAFEMLTLPVADGGLQRMLHGEGPAAARLLSIDDDGEMTALCLPSLIGQGVAVGRDVLRLGTRTLVAGGALTQDFVDGLLRTLPPRRPLRLVVGDATVLILPALEVARLRRRLELQVLRPLNVLAVTTNPFRLPKPYAPVTFFNAIAAALADRVALFDVVNGLAQAVPHPHDDAAAPVLQPVRPSRKGR